MNVGIWLSAAFWLCVVAACAGRGEQLPQTTGCDFSQYQWVKAREPYSSVTVTTGDLSKLCGDGYLACVHPMDAEYAIEVLPAVADRCLIEHERLHLLGWVHP